MKKSLILILILISNLAFGQNKKNKTNQFISEIKQEMKKENIHDFFIVKHLSPGAVRILIEGDPNACETDSIYFSLYAFWKKGDKLFIKKFDNCGAFNTVQLSDLKPFEFYKENFDRLKKEQERELTYKYYKLVKGKKHLFIRPAIFDATLRYFWFYKGPVEFRKELCLDYLTEEMKKNHPNLYKHNYKLTIIKLNSICQKVINHVTEQKLFTREK